MAKPLTTLYKKSLGDLYRNADKYKDVTTSQQKKPNN